MSITAVVNQKGGVGKTTVALGLTAALAARGSRVLVVDLDPQANATTGLGVWEADRTIDQVLVADSAGSALAAVRECGWPPGVLTVDPSVIPSSPALAQVEHQLVSDVIGAQDRLASAMEGVASQFDEVLIDCPPSLGLLTVNALFASDRVVVVTEPAAWSSDGVEQILRNVSRISQRRAGSPALAGIVVNRLGRTRDAGYWTAELGRTHPGLVLEPSIRLRAAIAESAAQSIPMHAMSRSGVTEALAEFEQLTDNVFGRPGPAVIDLSDVPSAEDLAVVGAAGPSTPGAGGRGSDPVGPAREDRY